MNRHHIPLSAPAALLRNLALAYAAYWLCRLAYWAENASALEGFWRHNTLADIVHGAWMFDTSAILYTNVLWVALLLLPLPFALGSRWQGGVRWLFVAINSVAVAMNLADAVYFQYTGRRTTSTVFSEFAAEGNLLHIVGVELLRHWYLVAMAAAIAYALARTAATATRRHGVTTRAELTVRGITLLAFIPLCVIGMRGGATKAVRPITISNANQWVERPAEAAVILNTPFALLRTLGVATFVTPHYFATTAELEAAYTPHHDATPPTAADTIAADTTYNVVVIIVESFGREYVGALNETLEGGTYRGYTPFVDSLCGASATFEWSFCNGRKSIDGMPAILSSIPMFIEPFILTPASMNDVGGIAAELAARGYTTAFFHGAQNGSMGFQAFARKTGFQRYYGRTEYDADTRFGGEADFDGTWAIWDEPFLQFMAAQLGDMPEPFLASVFTATSHHPYAVPKTYRDTFPEEGIAIHKCIRYTDHALRRFFQAARRQPWFGRTLFVLTSDHTNLSDHAFYQSDIGGFCSPILFFDPSQRLVAPGRRHGIAQHIDIMPTLLGLLGTRRPYVAFGQDLFATPPDSTWAVSYNNGTYQLARGGLLLQMDAATSTTRAVYELTDSLLRRNIIGQRPEQPHMERQLKAIVQQYMSRMNENRLTP